MHGLLLKLHWGTEEIEPYCIMHNAYGHWHIYALSHGYFYPETLFLPIIQGFLLFGRNPPSMGYKVLFRNPMLQMKFEVLHTIPHNTHTCNLAQTVQKWPRYMLNNILYYFNYIFICFRCFRAHFVGGRFRNLHLDLYPPIQACPINLWHSINIHIYALSDGLVA